jgi:hypothetical protein
MTLVLLNVTLPHFAGRAWNGTQQQEMRVRKGNSDNYYQDRLWEVVNTKISGLASREGGTESKDHKSGIQCRHHAWTSRLNE